MTPELYERLVEAFTHLGPQFTAVSRRTGETPATCRRAWQVGWVTAKGSLPPVRDVLPNLIRRRASLGVNVPEPDKNAVENRDVAYGDPALAPVVPDPASDHSDTAEILRSSSIEATQQETAILAGFRTNVIRAVNVSTRLLTGLESMAAAVGEKLIIQSRDVVGVRPSMLLRPLEQFTRIMSQLATTTKSVVEMQRLILGAPTSIVENRQSGGEAPLDADEADDRLRRLQATASLLMRAGQRDAIEALPYEGEESNVSAREENKTESVESQAAEQNDDLH